ncbi:hypothetical protein N5K21_27255 [Rhizobium pusense]|uniref:Uncharacterized protein n=1 Tax=Agrobacterium pusense TaxID=648995 RepID=A0A6H0ZI48_9HYPH|nr:hypothetical protein [Agrobacterium pusense]MDH2092420.1 hypothetical protein [Agrobacterium pusense]QCM13951.1 hypothetical protein CFBP6625_26290 [Agrobacterium tumefaciens]QIX19813.1 hypothetical protein FOB41_01190 [Agrobacterium pusense]WCK27594.1 hypothetical protein CFBP5496_0024795 [Agrobacterium pusense]
MTNVITLPGRKNASADQMRAPVDLNTLLRLRDSLATLTTSLQRELVFLTKAAEAAEGVTDRK